MACAQVFVLLVHSSWCVLQVEEPLFTDVTNVACEIFKVWSVF